MYMYMRHAISRNTHFPVFLENHIKAKSQYIFLAVVNQTLRFITWSDFMFKRYCLETLPKKCSHPNKCYKSNFYRWVQRKFSKHLAATLSFDAVTLQGSFSSKRLVSTKEQQRSDLWLKHIDWNKYFPILSDYYKGCHYPC